jgi:uncharacterized protein
MEYSFSAKGHSNISLKHKTTIEFTKDESVTKQGDCIAGVKADFSLDEIKKFLEAGQLKAKISAGNLTEAIAFIPNRLFDDSHEIVIRKGDHASSRTLGTGADRAAKDLSREFAKSLKNPEIQIKVTISDE